MTTIMHETYGYSLGGVSKYAVNRFLRLYPLYWVMLVITALAVLFATGQEFAAEYHKAIYFPASFSEFIFNMTMVFPAWNPITVDPRLLPATWALTIELLFYVLIGLGISRTRNLTLAWFGASVAYMLHPLAKGDFSLSLGYESFLSASLPFSIGALIYFYKDSLLGLLGRLKVASIGLVSSVYTMNLCIVVSGYFLYPEQAWKINYLGTFVNMILSTILIVILCEKGREVFSPKFDRFLGDFSYPIYLFHWTAALLVSFLLYGEVVRGLSVSGGVVFVVGLLFTFGVSYVVNHAVNTPVERVRSYFKKAH